ncbi:MULTISPECIES: FtsX-like permease family protein [unclassified Luteococcus]|uniref:FtsX-like permease family protein n=1 Tax=unclassified Luteococcus TaxID=2639923 RepID=UPI00313D85E4
MGTLGLLVRRNLRRGRLQLLVIGLRGAIAATMANVGLMCALRYPAMLDATVSRLNVPDVQLLTTADRKQAAEQAFRADPRVRQVETSSALTEFGTVPLAGSTMDSVVVYLNLDRPTSMGRSSVDQRRDAQYPDGIYLPLLFQTSGTVAVGDRFTVTTGQTTRTFTVAGFLENLYLGTTTMGAFGIGLPDAAYRQLAADAKRPAPQVMVQATVNPADQAPDVSAAVGQALARPGDSVMTTWLWNLPLLREALLPGPNVYAASLMAFAANVVLVVAMILWFWTRSAIDQDLAGIGVLATVGVTPATVRAALTLAPLAVVGLGCLAGIGASAAVVPRVANSLANQSGLEWQPGFDLGSAGIVLLGALLLTVVLGLLASRRVRTLRPVEALAGGQRAHSFRRGWWPLASTRGPLPLLLGLKTAIAQRGQSAMVLATMAVVALSAIFSTSLVTNVLNDRDAFTRNLIGEVGDITAQAKPGIDQAGLLGELRALPGVERAQFTDYLQGSIAGRQAVFVVTDDFASQAFSTVHRGREPRHPNEVAIGSQAARQAGVAVGQTITLGAGERRADYLVVGELSTIQYTGFRVNLTTEGYRRMVPGHQLTDVDLHAADGTDLPALVDRVREVGGARLSAVQNQKESIDSQLGVYMSMIQQLAHGVLALSVVVTLLVLALMTATMLRRQRSSFGVLAAMGHSRAAQVGQLLGCYLPLVLLGSGLGTLLGVVAVPRLLTDAMGSLGLSRFDFTTSVPLVAGVIGLLVLLALGITVLVALPSLRRRPVELLG